MSITSPITRRLGTARWVAFATVLAAAALISVAPAQAQFSGKAKVLDLDATCIAKGKAKGRVILDVTVRYADAAAQAEALYEGQGHLVSVVSKARLKGGSKLVMLDKGNAQEAIPEISSYKHVHRHRLSKAKGRKLMGGKRCGKARSPVVHLKVRADQALGMKAGKPKQRQLRGRATPVATQTAKANLSATVTAGDPGQVIGGCLVAADSNCHGVNMSGADLSNVVAPYSDFSFADLSNADLSNARLGHAIMNKTNLQFANMSGVQLGSGSLTSAIILSADLTGAALPFANLGNASLQGSDISGANLTATGLYGTVFYNTTCDGDTLLPVVFPHRCVNGSVTS